MIKDATKLVARVVRPVICAPQTLGPTATEIPCISTSITTSGWPSLRCCFQSRTALLLYQRTAVILCPLYQCIAPYCCDLHHTCRRSSSSVVCRQQQTHMQATWQSATRLCAAQHSAWVSRCLGSPCKQQQ
jgi:hypothetical protein